MAVRWDFTKCDTFTELYEGLTQEDIDYHNSNINQPNCIDVDDWCAAPHSPWFRPAESGDEKLKALGEEKQWVIMARKSFVGNVITVLMAVMPSPGWGLTEKNIDEAIRRILVYQEIYGPLGSKFVGPSRSVDENKSFWEDKYVTEAEIRLMVGLSINFSTITKTEYIKSVERWVHDKALARKRKAEREKAKQEKAKVE